MRVGEGGEEMVMVCKEWRRGRGGGGEENGGGGGKRLGREDG